MKFDHKTQILVVLINRNSTHAGKVVVDRDKLEEPYVLPDGRTYKHSRGTQFRQVEVAIEAPATPVGLEEEE